MKKELVRKIKASCVGIGIAEYGKPIPLRISGTGFIIDPEGYILTATHVIDGLEEQKKELEANGMKISICAFKVEVKDNHPLIKTRGLVERRRIIIKPTQKFLAPSNYDVIVCRMVTNEKYPSFLTIKKPSKIELDDEIAICGYPGGSGTFNFEDLETGVRLSPQLQTGNVSGVMPMDDVTKPTGIQTDIIGTGGSSGSPIVNANDGEVIGLAQRVLSSPVSTLDQKGLMGLAQIGLVFGVANYGFYAAVNDVVSRMKKELDETGRLKPEFKEKYEKDDSDYIVIDINKPEESVDTSKDEFYKES